MASFISRKICSEEKEEYANNSYGVFHTKEEALGSTLPLHKLSVISTVEQQKESLLNYWVQISVICALLCGFSIEVFFNPPSNQNDENSTINDTALQTHCFLNGFAFVFNFCGLFVSCIYYAMLNQLVTRISILNFLKKFGNRMILPTTFFCLGCCFIVIGFIFDAFLLYGLKWVPLLLSVCFCCAIVFIFFLWIWMQKSSIEFINDDIKRLH